MKEGRRHSLFNRFFIDTMLVLSIPLYILVLIFILAPRTPSGKYLSARLVDGNDWLSLGRSHLRQDEEMTVKAMMLRLSIEAQLLSSNVTEEKMERIPEYINFLDSVYANDAFISLPFFFGLKLAHSLNGVVDPGVVASYHSRISQELKKDNLLKGD